MAKTDFIVNVTIVTKDINEIASIRDKYIKQLEAKTVKYKNSEPLVLVSDVSLMVDDMLDEIIEAINISDGDNE